MNVIVTLEYRFKRTPDGAIWTEMAFQYSFWQRYLNVYDHVTVVARIEDVQELKSKHYQVNGEKVHVEALPYYIGPLGFLKNYFKIKKRLIEIVQAHPHDAVIMRVGSPIADVLQPYLKKKNRKYGVEVVGDPWEGFAPGTFKTIWRPLMRVYFTWKLKVQCAYATVASYVTEKTLQKSYPPKRAIHTIGASTIELLPEHIVSEPKTFDNKDFYVFTFVGSLELLRKAPDVLIEACSKLNLKKPNFQLNMVGGGRHQKELEDLAQRLGVRDKINFLGMVPSGDPIREILDQSDIFILPSRSEGLPRAMIEAMARALPSIGSDIGVIKELIPDEDTARVGDAEHLAQRMEEFMSSNSLLTQKSQRNLEESKKYRSDILEQRRTKMYTFLKEAIEVND